jgi:hypothetical protein
MPGALGGGQRAVVFTQQNQGLDAGTEGARNLSGAAMDGLRRLGQCPKYPRKTCDKTDELYQPCQDSIRLHVQMCDTVSNPYTLTQCDSAFLAWIVARIQGLPYE